MAKITVEETSEAPAHEATDSRGRKIALRKLNALDRMLLTELVGGENSKNEAYMFYATLAYHVASIGGEAVPRPAKKTHLEALVQRLDEDGLAAVVQALTGLYPEPAEAEALLKNASGTPAS